jgi:hypothetical protein
MRIRLPACIIILLLLGAFAASAQGAITLAQGKTSPTVDGVLGSGEYSVSADSSGMKLSLSWTGDVLSVAVSGQTSGWVAVGIGSAKMNDAVMYIAYKDGDKGQLKVQKGAGHRHADFDSAAPARYAVGEAGGQTILELALKASDFISRGQKQLELIYAMGAAKSFASMHSARASAVATLAQ